MADDDLVSGPAATSHRTAEHGMRYERSMSHRTSHRAPEHEKFVTPTARARQRQVNDVTLKLLRAGVPNAPVLAAKNLDDLLSIAAQNDVDVRPEAGVGAALQSSSEDEDDEGVLSNDRRRRQRLQYATQPASHAHTRARSWRHRYAAPHRTHPAPQPPPGRTVTPPLGAGGDAAPKLEACPGIYEGERNEHGERHGHGLYRFADGGVYDGEWRHNLQEVCAPQLRRMPLLACHYSHTGSIAGKPPTRPLVPHVRA